MRRHLLIVAAASIASTAIVSAPEASAHGPAPAPLQVLSWAADGAPDIVRTNIGLAVRDGAASYRYACPSQWAGSEQAPAAVSGDGAVTVAVGGGALFASTDGACAFSEVTSSWFVVDVLASADSVLALGRDFDTDAGALLRVTASEVEVAVEIVAEWPDLAPDSAWVAADGVIWVAGARPEPRVVRVLTDGQTEPVSLVELEVTGAARLSLRGDAREGRAWLVVTRDGERRLWRGPEWVPASQPATSLHGPVPSGEDWLALVDGDAVQIDDETAEDLDLGPVDWTCLRRLDGVAYACLLTSIEVLTASPLTTETGFHLSQLAGPSEACPAAADAATQCFADWVHFGGEAGLFEPPSPGVDGATDPPDDGSTEPTPTTSSGCAGQPAGVPLGPLAWGLLAALLLVATRRDS